MSVNNKNKVKSRNLYRGLGIRVAIKGDLDIDGQQKNRPAIVIKKYPSHVLVQLLSTQSSEHDYFSFFINNRNQYIRPIYFRTIKFNEIVNFWKDDENVIKLKKNSTFFTKVTEMQFKEITSTLDKAFELEENFVKSLVKEYELE